MPALRSIATKLSLLVGSLVVALLLAELYFRTVRPIKFLEIGEQASSDPGAWMNLIHRPSSVPGLAYELAPDLDREAREARVRTNSLGMRDAEPLARDTPGLLRVLALGDSVTYGYRVEAPQSYCSVLEQSFAEVPPPDGRRVEVLNTGVSGYSTRDEALALNGKWLALEPDVLLVGYCLNDPESDPRQPLPRFFTPPHWWQHSALARYLVQREQGRGVRELGGGRYFRYLHAPSTSAWRSVERGFDSIGGAARARGAPVVLVIFPLFSPAPWAEYEYREPHARVAEAAARHGFLVLDLLARFEREDPQSLILDEGDSHPNARGHQIAAEAIREFLLSHWGVISGRR
ncbi:MAG: SGNH/GDSL hydrolase family protein [Planctomycetes bacterium]|nr:SGNH/GDSL hydrolase family protein [Planctomycetota bacterium]